MRDFTQDCPWFCRYSECPKLKYRETIAVTYPQRQTSWLMSLIALVAILGANGCTAIGKRTETATAAAPALAAGQYPAVPQPQDVRQTPRRNYPAQPASYADSTPWTGIFGSSGSC